MTSILPRVPWANVVTPDARGRSGRMLLLVACSTTDPADKPDPLDTSAMPAEEVCNGVDDDGDTDVDEGFPDDDGNGRVDCLDATCPALDMPAAGPVDAVDACTTAALVADPWRVRTVYQAETPSLLHPEADNVAATPIVTQLDDDNGDGTIDNDDDPDILLDVFEGSDDTVGTLVALDGPTGALKWEVDGIFARSGLAAGDVDRDGEVDVLAVAETGQAIAVHADGSPLWRGGVLYTDATDEAPIVLTDWNSDGRPEVFVGSVGLDGPTGDAGVDFGFDHRYVPPGFADIDLDGRYELLDNGIVVDKHLDVILRGAPGLHGAWAFALQADNDAEAEVAFVTDALRIYDTDGILLGDMSGLGVAPLGGPPAVGDFDGDGAVELAWAYDGTMYLVESDMTVVWTSTMGEASTSAGACGVDLDGDGALEILYADEYAFRILDGRTGAQLYADEGHHATPISEYPVPVDLDHDGHTEILVPSSGDGAWGALTVLAHDGSGWMSSAKTWPVHDYNQENVGDDGAVPSTPPTPWQHDNVLRAVPTQTRPVADLAATITDTCLVDCTFGPAAIAVQVSNQGANSVAIGATLELWADDNGEERLITTQALPTIDSARSLDTIQFEVGIADVPQTAWIVRVSAPPAYEECDTTDNEARSGAAICP